MKKILLLILIWIVGSAISVFISYLISRPIIPFLGHRGADLIGYLIIAVGIYITFIIIPAHIPLSKEEFDEIKDSKLWVEDKGNKINK